MSDKTHKDPVRARADEMWDLAKKELGGDHSAGEDFQRRLNYLAVCGDKVGAPWPEVARQMRADYAKNQQRHDAGKPYDQNLPVVIIVDSENQKAAGIVFKTADYAPQNLLQKLIPVLRVEGTAHRVTAEKPASMGGTGYTKDECVNIDRQPLPQRSKSLAPRG